MQISTTERFHFDCERVEIFECNPRSDRAINALQCKRFTINDFTFQFIDVPFCCLLNASACSSDCHAKSVLKETSFSLQLPPTSFLPNLFVSLSSYSFTAQLTNTSTLHILNTLVGALIMKLMLQQSFTLIVRTLIRSSAHLRSDLYAHKLQNDEISIYA